MVIDCDRCAVRGERCEDCVVSVFFGVPPDMELTAAECRAIDLLSRAGLVSRVSVLPVRGRGSGRERSEVA